MTQKASLTSHGLEYYKSGARLCFDEGIDKNARFFSYTLTTLSVPTLLTPLLRRLLDTVSPRLFKEKISLACSFIQKRVGVGCYRLAKFCRVLEMVDPRLIVALTISGGALVKTKAFAKRRYLGDPLMLCEFLVKKL